MEEATENALEMAQEANATRKKDTETKTVKSYHNGSMV
jgi:hypothetical protein